MQHLKLTVSEFNAIFADIVHHQLQLNQLCICGEITQINAYKNTHMYLSISHNDSHLPVAVYNYKKKGIPLLKKGDQCEVFGQCTYLKNKGQLMFSAVRIAPLGSGKKTEAFAARIAEFKAQGLFDKKTPKQMPRLVERVAIITAKASAAYHDIRSILEKNPHPFEPIVVPATVQGFDAPGSLIQALAIAESLAPDVICISRGGGAQHDFDCFFDTELATAICNSPIPIIAGIGHDINTTLSCLCANAHFETPTAMIQWLCSHSIAPIIAAEDALNSIYHRLIQQVDELKHNLSNTQQLATNAIDHALNAHSQKLTTLTATAIALNPLNKLSNGFAYCQDENKKPLTTIDQMKKNATIYLTLKNGKAEATITNVNQGSLNRN